MSTEADDRLQQILFKALAEQDRLGNDAARLRALVDNTASAIANALRDDLTVVAGNSELIEMRHLSDAAHRFADNALLAATSATRTLHRVALLSSIGKGTGKSVDVHREIMQLQGSLNNEIRANIRLTWASTPGRFSLQADPDEFRMILRELLQNALDALPDGGHVAINSREVRLRSQPDSNTSSWWHAIEMIDSGVGLSETAKPEIHTPAFVVDGRMTLALGFSLLDRFVFSLGGLCDIDSGNTGTTVTLLLPLETGT